MSDFTMIILFLWILPYAKPLSVTAFSHYSADSSLIAMSSVSKFFDRHLRIMALAFRLLSHQTVFFFLFSVLEIIQKT